MPRYRSSGSSAPRPLLLPAAEYVERIRHAVFRTLPGRAIVLGALIKLVVLALRLLGFTPVFLSVIDTVAGLASAAGLAYFLFRLLVLAKRRLLWRVRRKMILSYIFIGFVPAILIGAFFVLCGLLLFYNFSSYLVQTQLRVLEDQARFIASSTALEVQRAGGREAAAIVQRKQANGAARYEGLSITIVPVARSCASPSPSASAESGPPRAPSANPNSTLPASRNSRVPFPNSIMSGPWSHVDPPAVVPAWIGCDGFTGLMAYSRAIRPPPLQPGSRAGAGDQPGQRAKDSNDTDMFVRAVAYPDAPAPGYAVVVDLLVGAESRQRLRRETGVDLKTVTTVPFTDRPDAEPLRGKPGGVSASSFPGATNGPLSWVTLLTYRDWNTGVAGTLLVSTQLSIAEIYDRIAAAQGLIGSRLLLALLVVVGGLFL